MSDHIRKSIYVKIVEQPCPNGAKFRYETELQKEKTRRLPALIKGKSSTKDYPTFPALKISGFRGTVRIYVYPVTEQGKPHFHHPHKLVGDGCESGVFSTEVNVDYEKTLRFRKLRIECTKGNEEKNALADRERYLITEQIVQPDAVRFGRPDWKQINKNLRLCFQVVGLNENGEICASSYVISEPIYDKKFVDALNIVHLSVSSASVIGGKTLDIQCGPIKKSATKVKFFETINGETVWEAFGKPSCSGVTGAGRISIETPPYINQHVQEQVKCFIQLISDGAKGEPTDFTLLPFGETPSDPNIATPSHNSETPSDPNIATPSHNSETPSDLNIIKLSHNTAKVAGGENIILLCRGIDRNDIEVVFYEEREGHKIWSQKGKFSSSDVHDNSAIVFQTPAYRNVKILKRTTTCYIQLKRPSDGCVGRPEKFEFLADPGLDLARRKFQEMMSVLQEKYNFSPAQKSVAEISRSRIPRIVDTSYPNDANILVDMPGRSIYPNNPYNANIDMPGRSTEPNNQFNDNIRIPGSSTETNNLFSSTIGINNMTHGMVDPNYQHNAVNQVFPIPGLGNGFNFPGTIRENIAQNRDPLSLVSNSSNSTFGCDVGATATYDSRITSLDYVLNIAGSIVLPSDIRSTHFQNAIETTCPRFCRHNEEINVSKFIQREGLTFENSYNSFTNTAGRSDANRCDFENTAFRNSFNTNPTSTNIPYISDDFVPDSFQQEINNISDDELLSIINALTEYTDEFQDFPSQPTLNIDSQVSYQGNMMPLQSSMVPV